jgi:hypothetical protein
MFLSRPNEVLIEKKYRCVILQLRIIVYFYGIFGRGKKTNKLGNGSFSRASSF